jgi:hypothetical protein
MAGFKQAECLIEVQQDSNCKGVRPQKWLIAAKAQRKNHTSATFLKETFKEIIEMFTSDVDIHLIEIKYCEDIRPQNQLSTVQEQHKGLCSIFQGAPLTLHTMLYEWVAPLQQSYAGALS